jgi:serine/threonine protein kinase
MHASSSMPLAAAVQEHCPCGSLQEQLCLGSLAPDGSSARWRQLLGILRDVAAGLAHLHSHGVAHGSLTPLNVMLVEAGDPIALGAADDGSDRVPALAAKLSCAGLADFMLPLDPGGADAPVHFYLAPEAQRTRAFTAAGDIYSFGVRQLRLCVLEM